MKLDGGFGLQPCSGGEAISEWLVRGLVFSVTYQWGNPQRDEVENAEGVAIPR